MSPGLKEAIRKRWILIYKKTATFLMSVEGDVAENPINLAALVEELKTLGYKVKY